MEKAPGALYNFNRILICEKKHLRLTFAGSSLKNIKPG
jgi:hypothetical protein